MRPLVVVWRVTAACDLACAFCGYSRELRRPRPSATPEAVLAFGQALAEHARALGRPALLSWLGGEPLLWPPLRTVGPALRALGLQLGVTTNGRRLDEDAWSAHLGEHYAQVTVSVDGLEAWHDQVRGEAGLFARLRAGLGRLAERRARRAAGPRLRVNTVLMRSNLAGFAALARELAAWGVDELTFNLLGGQERGGAFFERERVPPAEFAAWRAQLPDLRRELAGRGLELRGAEPYLARLDAQAAGRPWPVADCGPGRDFLFLDEAGRAGPCSFTAALIGRPLAEAGHWLATPGVWDDALRQTRPAACGDCRSTQVFGKFQSA